MSRKLSLRLTEARSLLPSDLNGYSDPYAIIYYVGKKEKKIGKTEWKARTLNPYWNYNINKIINVEPGDSIIIKIFDHDASSDDCLGAAKIQLDSFFDGLWSSKWYPLFDKDLKNPVRGAVLVGLHIVDPEADSFREEHRRPDDVEVIPHRYESIRIAGGQQMIIPKPVPVQT